MGWWRGRAFETRMTRRGAKGTKGGPCVSWLSCLFVGFVFQSLPLSLSAPVPGAAFDGRRSPTELRCQTMPPSAGMGDLSPYVALERKRAKRQLTNPTFGGKIPSAMPKWRNRQTRCVQGAVGISPCGFKSHLRHHPPSQVSIGLGFVFCRLPAAFDFTIKMRYHYCERSEG